MTIQQPPQPLQSFALLAAGQAPLFFADIIDSRIQGFDNMETVQHQCSVRAVVGDGPDVRCTHVAARPLDLFLLIVTEDLVEENINGFAPFPRPNPHDAGPIQVVDQRGVLVALGVGDFVDSESFQAPDLMSITGGGNAPVQQIRERRRWSMQQCGRSVLWHHLTVA